MARELKLFFVSMGLVVSGTFILGVTYFVIPSTFTHFRLWFFVFFVSGALWLIVGAAVFLSETTCSVDTFFLALRWRFIVKRPFKEFPLYAQEREALPLRKWAEEMLEEEATLASTWFYYRDKAINKLSELKSEVLVYEGIQTPSDLPEARRKHWMRTAVEEEIVASHSKDADCAWKHFLKLFDLFRDLGMCPTNPVIQAPWDNPNRFRLYVLEKRNIPPTHVNKLTEQIVVTIPAT